MKSTNIVTYYIIIQQQKVHNNYFQQTMHKIQTITVTAATPIIVKDFAFNVAMYLKMNRYCVM